jgi:uncharacterized membrane protein YsdA (DUF1294 family)
MENIFYHPLYLWIASWSTITFLLFGFDKWMAIARQRRIPEKTLFALIIVGGVLGGWLGMIVFRHKKNKDMFFLVLLLATLLHGYLVYRFAL